MLLAFCLTLDGALRLPSSTEVRASALFCSTLDGALSTPKIFDCVFLTLF